MLTIVAAIVVGLIVLVWSSDRFVGGAAALANSLGISPLIIGLTVVALGTSAPEILVSASAAIQGSTPLAIGNAQGSNIANLGLVLAVCALIIALPVNRAVWKRESYVLLGVTLALGAILWDLHLSFLEGALLVVLMALFISYTVWSVKKAKDVAELPDFSEDIPDDMPLGKAVFWVVAGLILLVLGAQSLVWGATELALRFGISELVVGATIVAIGTSLPELATSITSTLKGHHEMTIGNVVGSNIFNILAVIGIAGMIAPTDFEAAVFWRDYVFVLGLTLLLLVVAWWFGRHNKAIPRVFGLVLLAAYLYYLYLNYMALSA
ncbi:calcium/sodium antiporter [Salinispirillum marinum]|uniref:Calcium/sodium antiporter n=2 Tax=Saccharospirillaceae TaxID=255527 RepID=A0ABV8B926_9GAMM